MYVVNAVALGLPPALEHWTNEKVLRFILLMWENTKLEQEARSVDKELDLLHLLSTVVQPTPHITIDDKATNATTTSLHGGSSSTSNIISTINCTGPLDPRTVVAVAQRAYDSFHAQQLNMNVVNSNGGGQVNRGGIERGLEESVGDGLLRLHISSAVAREEREASFDSPVTEDANILEANGCPVLKIDGVEEVHQQEQDDNYILLIKH